MPRKLTTQEFIERATALHLGKYDYSKVEYINNETPVLIICPKHGEFWQKPANHCSVKRCGCSKCKSEITSIFKRNNTEYFISKSTLVHGIKYDYSLVEYKTNRDPVIIICPIHGEFKQKPIDHLDGCGCKECGRLNTIRYSKTHGNSNHYMYNTWVGIKDRCYNEKCKSYPRYGGIGIKMSNEFINNFGAFLEYVSSLDNYDKKISEGYSLDRIDNSKGYERGNLRWADAKTQRNNQRVRGAYGYNGININKNGLWNATIVIKLSGFQSLSEALHARNEYIIAHNLPHKIQEV